MFSVPPRAGADTVHTSPAKVPHRGDDRVPSRPGVLPVGESAVLKYSQSALSPMLPLRPLSASMSSSLLRSNPSSPTTRPQSVSPAHQAVVHWPDEPSTPEVAAWRPVVAGARVYDEEGSVRHEDGWMVDMFRDPAVGPWGARGEFGGDISGGEEGGVGDAELGGAREGGGTEGEGGVRDGRPAAGCREGPQGEGWPPVDGEGRRWWEGGGRRRAASSGPSSPNAASRPCPPGQRSSSPPPFAVQLHPGTKRLMFAFHKPGGRRGRPRSGGGVTDTPHCSKFDHVDGCTVCRSLYPHHRLPDGRQVHLFHKDVHGATVLDGYRDSVLGRARTTPRNWPVC